MKLAVNSWGLQPVDNNEVVENIELDKLCSLRVKLNKTISLLNDQIQDTLKEDDELIHKRWNIDVEIIQNKLDRPDVNWNIFENFFSISSYWVATKIQVIFLNANITSLCIKNWDSEIIKVTIWYGVNNDELRKILVIANIINFCISRIGVFLGKDKDFSKSELQNIGFRITKRAFQQHKLIFNWSKKTTVLTKKRLEAILEWEPVSTKPDDEDSSSWQDPIDIIKLMEKIVEYLNSDSLLVELKSRTY